jgi:hypothetical protein
MMMHFFTCGFHSGGCVDRVSEQTVPWHGEANDACATRARVKSNSQTKRRPRQVLDSKAATLVQQVQRHGCYLRSVVFYPFRDPSHDHIGVPNRLHLEHR